MNQALIYLYLQTRNSKRKRKSQKEKEKEVVNTFLNNAEVLRHWDGGLEFELGEEGGWGVRRQALGANLKGVWR